MIINLIHRLIPDRYGKPTPMEMAQLEYFSRVVQEKSFSKAADKVFRTQPAVSIAIRRLEEEIGLPLLDRTQKTPVLTEAGKVVYDYAQRILGLRDQVGQAIAEMQTLKRGLIRVGANESTSLYLLPELILRFREQHPDVKVEIFRHVSSRLPREVLERNVDFALMASEPGDRDLEAFPLLKDELVLIMSPKHSLASRPAVRIKDLGTESFVAHNVKSGSRVKVIEAFARQHTPLNISLELATIETIKRFVQKRVGLAFVPRMCVREELERGVLVSVPVRGLTHTRTLWAAHRRGANFSPAAASFLHVLKAHAEGN